MPYILMSMMLVAVTMNNLDKGWWFVPAVLAGTLLLAGSNQEE